MIFKKRRQFSYLRFCGHYIFSFAFLLLAGAHQIQAQANTRHANDLNFMLTYNGQYAFDVKLFSVPPFK